MTSDYFVVRGKKKNCDYGICWNDTVLIWSFTLVGKREKERELNTKEKDKRARR